MLTQKCRKPVKKLTHGTKSAGPSFAGGKVGIACHAKYTRHLYGGCSSHG